MHKNKLMKKRRAAKMPNWMTDYCAAKTSPVARRVFKDSKLGSFGAASPVRIIDPKEYQDAMEKGKADRDS